MLITRLCAYQLAQYMFLALEIYPGGFCSQRRIYVSENFNIRSQVFITLKLMFVK